MTRPEAREADRVCILVPGMHRSGTSALARVLSIMGATLPRTLMAANPTNPAGHWESDAVRELNDELLRIAGRTWNDWTPIEPDFFASLSARAKLAEGRRIIADEYDDAALFVLKDPRIAVLAPFWLELLGDMGIAAAVICPVRHPLEVARSLAVREGFAIGEAHLIWLRHVLAAEAATRGQPRLYTSYDQLLDDWQEIAGRIQRELGVAWPRSVSSRQGEVSDFLEASLRHQEVDRIDANADPHRSGWMWQVFKVLSRWAQEGEDAKDHPLLDEIMSTFDAAAPAFERVIAAGSDALARIHRLESVASDPRYGSPLTLEAAVADARGGPDTVTAAEAQAMLAAAHATIAERDRSAAELATRITEAEALATGAQAAVAERDRTVAELTDQLAVAQGEAAEARSRREAALAAFSTELADAQRSAAEAHARAQATGAAQAELRRSLDDTASALSDTRTECETVSERLRHRDSQLEQRGEELTQLSAELSDTRSKLTDEAGRANGLAAENARQRAQHGELEAWVFRAAGERRAEQQVLARLRGEVAPLQRERDALKSAVAMRDQTLGELRGEIKLLTQARDAAERLAADADRQAGDAQASHDHQASRLDEARHELASLARMVAEAQDALAAERDKNREQLAQVQTGQADRIATLEVDLAARERKREEAEVARRRAEEAQIQTMRDAKDRQAAALQVEQRLREADEWRAEAEERLRSTQTRHAEAAAAQRRVEAERDDLAAKLIAARSAFEALQTRAVEERLRVQKEAETAAQNSEWVRQVTFSLSGGRWWWPLLPKHRQRKLARRLKNKGLFDSEAYLALYPDVASSGHTAIEHYLRHGIEENRSCPR